MNTECHAPLPDYPRLLSPLITAAYFLFPDRIHDQQWPTFTNCAVKKKKMLIGQRRWINLRYSMLLLLAYSIHTLQIHLLHVHGLHNMIWAAQIVPVHVSTVHTASMPGKVLKQGDKVSFTPI